MRAARCLRPNEALQPVAVASPPRRSAARGRWRLHPFGNDVRAAIRLELTDPNPGPELVHEFRNFGEDVYRALRAIGPAGPRLDDVDRATRSVVVRDIRRRDLGRVTDAIERVTRRYGWAHTVRVVRVDRDPRDPPN